MADLGVLAFPLQLSLLVAAASTVMVALVGVPIAYQLATREFPGRRVAEVLVLLPLVLPPLVSGYFLLLLIGRNGALGHITQTLTGTPFGLTFTWQAAVLASFVVSLPLGISGARSAIAAVDAHHADTARTLGRTELETAILVVLPLAGRGILAALALSFARAVGEFGATVMVAGNIPGRTNTMALEVYNAVVAGDWRTATMLAAVFMGVSAVVLLGVDRMAVKVAR